MVEEARAEHFAQLFTQALVALDEIVGCDGFEVGGIDGCLQTQGDDLRIELRIVHIKLLALDQALDVELFESCLLCPEFIYSDGLRIGTVGNLVDVGKVSSQLKLQRRQQTSLDVIFSPICLVRALSAVRMVATGVVGAYLATELAIAWREESAAFEAVQAHPEGIRHLAMRVPRPIDKNFLRLCKNPFINDRRTKSLDAVVLAEIGTIAQRSTNGSLAFFVSVFLTHHPERAQDCTVLNKIWKYLLHDGCRSLVDVYALVLAEAVVERHVPSDDSGIAQQPLMDVPHAIVGLVALVLCKR